MVVWSFILTPPIYPVYNAYVTQQINDRNTGIFFFDSFFLVK